MGNKGEKRGNKFGKNGEISEKNLEKIASQAEKIGENSPTAKLGMINKWNLHQPIYNHKKGTNCILNQNNVVLAQLKAISHAVEMLYYT